jgi:hypothetical protein
VVVRMARVTALYWVRHAASPAGGRLGQLVELRGEQEVRPAG